LGQALFTRLSATWSSDNCSRKVKSINGRVPVVLLTGWEVTFTNEELRDKWVDLVIKKPFEVNQVLGVVQQGMELRDRSTKV